MAAPTPPGQVTEMTREERITAAAIILRDAAEEMATAEEAAVETERTRE